jgi:hypothetical protein
MAICKYEGEVKVTAAITVGTFAGSVITLPIGNYFLTSVGDGGATRSLLAELKNQLDTGPGGVWTLTLDDTTDTALGKVTIARNSNYTATWTSTSIRDLLGFTGDLSTAGTASFTGANQAKALWLPNCGRSGILSPQASTGAVASDYTASVSPGGTVYAIAYSTRGFDTMEHRTVVGSKAWTSLEVTVNEAFETFYRYVIAHGYRLRFHKDRSDDATYRTWNVANGGSYNPVPVREDWADSAKSLWSFRYDVLEVS